MKSRILMTAALFAITTGAFAQTAQPDLSALKDMEHEWVSAGMSGDRATIDKLLDPSFVSTTAGKRRSKEEVLRAPAPPSGSSQTLQNMQVQVEDRETAIVTGVNVYRASANAQPQNYFFTDVFKFRPDGWRIVSSDMTR